MKIDLGCGLAKSPGFIGVDRTPMPGVDVVADLNQRLPFEDDSVELIVASHSLEHVADIVATMKELYRICRHGAQICIIAPYYEQKLNVANPYHIVPFNEHTARFFTSSPVAGTDPAQYWHPHAVHWGLAESDNSHPGVDFRLASLEFFYFPEFLAFSNDAKLFMRRHMWDVCDQMLCQLVVWKRPEATDEEVCAAIEQMTLFEPVFIEERRTKDAALLASQANADSPAVRQSRSAMSELMSGRATDRGSNVRRDEAASFEATLQRVRTEMESRFGRLYSELAGSKIEIADLKIASAKSQHVNAQFAGELQVLREQMKEVCAEVTATRDSLDAQQAEYRRQQTELAAARRALNEQRRENDLLVASMKRQAQAVEEASGAVSMQTALLRQAWADAISSSAEVALYRRRRLVRFASWLRSAEDLTPNLPAPFQGVLSAVPTRARAVLGDDLRGRPFIAYRTYVEIDNPRKLEIGIHAAVKNLADAIGVELVADGGRIVFHQTRMLDESWHYGPVEFTLDGVDLRRGNLIELRLFSPDAKSPIYPLEVRRGRWSRKRTPLYRWI
jgi:SAM-dependent methyltransferase